MPGDNHLLHVPPSIVIVTQIRRPTPADGWHPDAELCTAGPGWKTVSSFLLKTLKLIQITRVRNGARGEIPGSIVHSTWLSVILSGHFSLNLIEPVAIKIRRNTMEISVRIKNKYIYTYIVYDGIHTIRFVSDKCDMPGFNNISCCRMSRDGCYTILDAKITPKDSVSRAVNE